MRFEQYRFARGRVVGGSLLTIIGLMTTGGVEAFYQLNGQCEDQRAVVLLHEGAAGVFRR